jgi:uncharacterized membrane protein YozB (DUF420 family)
MDPETMRAVMPAVSAGLNLLATLLLAAGWLFIRRSLSKPKPGPTKGEPAAEPGTVTVAAAARDPLADPDVRLHRVCMIAAFATSVLFLVNYLWYHFAYQIHKPYAGPPALKPVYLFTLATHVPLAVVVPVLAIWVFRLAFTGQWERHRRIARITFPIWMYVSVTGVLIWVMLYLLPQSPAAN